MERRELIAISQSPIFRDIDIVELDMILESHHPIVKHYAKGEIICQQGAELERLIIVIDGRLKAQMTSEEGKVINMEEFSNYQPVAIPVLFSESNTIPVTLFALDDSEIFFLSKETLIKCCMENSTILTNTMAVMSKKVDFLSKKIKFLQLHNIKQKIASTLLGLVIKNTSRSFKLGQSKEELAKEMGVTRPSLSREFMNLINEGIISQDKDFITILDPERLKNYK